MVVRDPKKKNKIGHTPFAYLSDGAKMKVRKRAYKFWAMSVMEGNEVTHQDICRKYNITMDDLNYYIEKDRWSQRLHIQMEKNEKGMALRAGKAKKKISVFEHDEENKEEIIDEVHNILMDSELSEHRRLFILHYLQSYDPEQAALKAGYSDKSAGNKLINNPTVDITLRKIKKTLNKTIYLTSHDVLSEYIKIAFADITDFVEFNDQEVKLKDSRFVNGKMISEIKQGKDGISIKLHDKMKALNELSRLFDLIPDKRLELEREKFEHQKEQDRIKNGTDEEENEIIDDIE